MSVLSSNATIATGKDTALETVSSLAVTNVEHAAIAISQDTRPLNALSLVLPKMLSAASVTRVSTLLKA